MSFALTPTMIRMLDAELVEEQRQRPRLKRSQLYREIFEELVGPWLDKRRGGRGGRRAGARGAKLRPVDRAGVKALLDAAGMMETEPAYLHAPQPTERNYPRPQRRRAGDSTARWDHGQRARARAHARSADSDET